MATRVDPHWVEALLAQAGWVRRIAGELVANDLADDVAQEVWVTSLRRPPDDRTTPRAWLKTVASSLVRSGFRRDRRREDREVRSEEGAARPADSPEDLAARMELQRVLADEIVRLPEPYRQTVILRYLEGLSAAEIARSLDVPAGTVRRRLKMGLDRLRQALDERNGGRREVWLRALLPLVGSPSPSARPEASAATGAASFRWVPLVVAGAATVAGLTVAVRSPPASPPQPASSETRRNPVRSLPFSPAPGPSAPPAGGVLTGSVRAADGRGVDGAVVTLSSLATSKPFGTTTTAGGGRFELANVPPGEFGITAAAEDAWAARAPVDVSAEAARVDLVLARGASALEGRVLDGGGGGLPGATVTVWSNGQRWSPDRVFEVQADETGHYRLSVPPDRYLFRAKRAGYGRAEGWLDVPAVRHYDVRLLPSARVGGRVVERASGAPVAEAAVTAVDAVGRTRATTTDAAGAFTLEVDAGPHQLWARKGGLLGTVARLEAQPAELSETEIAVAPVPPITGRVLGSRGSGAPGVDVRALPLGRTLAERDHWPTARSGPDGSFRLDGLPPSAIELSADAPGAAPVLVRIPSTTGLEERRAELRLLDEALVRGRVTEPGGAPASARISARIATADPSGKLRVTFRTVSSDSHGRFQIERLPAGDVWLAVESTTGGVTFPSVERLAPGEARELTVTLDPPSRLSGTVVFPDGAPAPGVRVEAATLREGEAFGFRCSAVSDVQGRFTLAPLPAGPLSLRLGVAWRSSPAGTKLALPRDQRLTIGAGEHRTGIAFVVPRSAGRISGMVVDSDHRPVGGAAVDLYLEDTAGRVVDFERRAFTDETGAFELADVSDGRHRARVRHPAFAPAPARTVAPGDTGVVLRVSR